MKLLFEYEIGDGAFGRVWLAGDANLPRRYAVKFFDKKPEAAEFEAVEHARALARVDHAAVVRLYSLEEQPHPETGVPAIALIMEYVDGFTLDRLRETLEPDRVEKIVGDMIGGLEAIHAVGLVHGDLHDKNVLITPQGAKLIDILCRYSPEEFGTRTRNATAREDIRDLAGLVRQVLEWRASINHQALSDAYYRGSTQAQSIQELRQSFEQVLRTRQPSAPSSSQPHPSAASLSLPEQPKAAPTASDGEPSIVADDAPAVPATSTPEQGGAHQLAAKTIDTVKSSQRTSLVVDLAILPPAQMSQLCAALSAPDDLFPADAKSGMDKSIALVRWAEQEDPSLSVLRRTAGEILHQRHGDNAWPGEHVWTMMELAATLDSSRERLMQQRSERRARIAEYLDSIATCVDGIIEASTVESHGLLGAIRTHVLGALGRGERMVRLRRLCSELDTYQKSLIDIAADDVETKVLADALKALRLSSEAPGFIWERETFLEADTVWSSVMRGKENLQRAHEQLAASAGLLRAIANGLRVR